MYVHIHSNCDGRTYEAVAHQRRGDNSGGNRVHADAIGPEEVGHATGNTKHTCYMNGQRWIETASIDGVDRTLSRAVREATSGDWVSDGRGNVHNATPLFAGTRTKRPLVGVLTVDGIRDDGVDGEGSVRVHVQHLGKVLSHC